MAWVGWKEGHPNARQGYLERGSPKCKARRVGKRGTQLQGKESWKEGHHMRNSCKNKRKTTQGRARKEDELCAR
jgi:hypothetical protein